MFLQTVPDLWLYLDVYVEIYSQHMCTPVLSPAPYRVDRKRIHCISCFRCECGVCKPIPEVVECVCCKESAQEVVNKMEDYEVNCITQHPGFNSVCPDVHVLQTAYFGYRQDHGHHHDERTHKYTSLIIYSVFTIIVSVYRFSVAEAIQT